MLSDAVAQGLQVYGISIAISMLVAVLIKVLVTLTGRVGQEKSEAVAALPVAKPAPALVVADGINEETVAVISAAVAAAVGHHQIIHVAESGHAWSNIGRAAQHSHHVTR